MVKSSLLVNFFCSCATSYFTDQFIPFSTDFSIFYACTFPRPVRVVFAKLPSHGACVNLEIRLIHPFDIFGAENIQKPLTGIW